MIKQAVFSTASFPTIEYSALLLQAVDPWIDSHEHFVKQTNRSRYHISGPEGIQSLHIPINHKNLYIISIKDVKISYDLIWQRTHWRTIITCYNRSAYFEYYADELEKLFLSRHTFLFDFNAGMLAWIFKSLKKELVLQPAPDYRQQYDDRKDLRPISDRPDTIPLYKREFRKYPQVFEEKNGFKENLSVIDLIFNMGPASVDYL